MVYLPTNAQMRRNTAPVAINMRNESDLDAGVFDGKTPAVVAAITDDQRALGTELMRLVSSSSFGRQLAAVQLRIGSDQLQ